MTINIIVISDNFYKDAYKIQCEYLNNETYSDFLARTQGKNFYCISVIENLVVGVCYGSPKSSKTFCLEGIAVSDRFWGRGIGSKMLVFFEKQLKSRNYKQLQVGLPQNEQLENFYTKNGFIPLELVVREGEAEVTRTSIKNLKEAKKQVSELLKNAKQDLEVSFIFGKNLIP